MALQELKMGDMDWIDFTQDRDRWRALVNAVMSLWVSHDEGNLLTSYGTVSFSSLKFYCELMHKRIVLKGVLTF